MSPRYNHPAVNSVAIRELLAEGKTLAEIADELGYASPQSVANAMKKFGLQSLRTKNK